MGEVVGCLPLLLLCHSPCRRDDAAAASSAAAAAAPRVGPSLYGAWKLAKLFVADSRQQMELLILHLPQQQVAALKALAAGELGWKSGEAGWAAGHARTCCSECGSLEGLVKHLFVTAPKPSTFRSSNPDRLQPAGDDGRRCAGGRRPAAARCAGPPAAAGGAACHGSYGAAAHAERLLWQCR